MGDLFSLERLISAFPKVLSYLPVTLKIAGLSALFGILLGIIVAFLRIERIPVIHQLLGVYISFARGTPILVQMLIVYYGMPMLLMAVTGIDINRWAKINFVIVAFILNEGAFLSEIFRGAILSIPPGQTEAGYSVGMTKVQSFRRIVLPQAFRVAIPPLGMDLVGLMQGCSLAYMIGVTEIVGGAHFFGTNGRHYFEAYLSAAIIFIILSLLLRAFFKIIDVKLAQGVRSL